MLLAKWCCCVCVSLFLEHLTRSTHHRLVSDSSHLSHRGDRIPPCVISTRRFFPQKTHAASGTGGSSTAAAAAAVRARRLPLRLSASWRAAAAAALDPRGRSLGQRPAGPEIWRTQTGYEWKHVGFCKAGNIYNGFNRAFGLRVRIQRHRWSHLVKPQVLMSVNPGSLHSQEQHASHLDPDPSYR